MRLRHVLHQHDLLQDEKQWVDRPIYDPVRLHGVISEIENLLESNDQNKNENQDHLHLIDFLINTCLAPIEKEVRIHKHPMTHFIPGPNSLLFNALILLKKKTAEGPFWHSIHSMALFALENFRYLYRELIPLESVKKESGSGSPASEFNSYDLDYVMAQDQITYIIHRALDLCRGDRVSRNPNSTGIVVDIKNVYEARTCPFTLKVDPSRSTFRGKSTVLPMPKAILVPG